MTHQLHVVPTLSTWGFIRGVALLLLPALFGCGGGGSVAPAPRGDCIAADQSVVRRDVTEDQCTAICPDCSWVSNDEQ